MTSKLTTFVHYLFSKKSEIKDLEAKDALLAKVVLDIHRKKTGTEKITIPLFSLNQIHAIDRENAIASTAKRVKQLEASKDALLSKQILSEQVLFEYLPSVSAIKVVKECDDNFIAFEGNGRLVALQTVFEPTDAIQIEVEEYTFKSTKKILRRMQRVRRMNGLL